MPADDKTARVLDTYEAVLTFFRARLSNNQRHEANDLAQETILAALKQVSGKEGGSIRSIPTFILGIAHHKFQDFLRRKRRHPAVPLEVVSEDEDLRLVASRTQLVKILEEEQCRILMEAIEQLDTAERSLLHLRCVEELPNAKAADRLGIAPDEASRVFYRVRAALKRQVDEESRGGSHWPKKEKGR